MGADGVKRSRISRLVLLLLGFALVAVLLLGALLTKPGPSRPGRAAAGSLLQPVPLAVDKSLGVNADLSRYGDEAREEVLSAMELAGFRWLRQRFPWDQIEPEPERYDWEIWDRVVADARRHNITIVPVLDGAPGWARGDADVGNPYAPPAEARDFGTFAASFAARYGDQIDYYQFWDEPNIAPHWGTREIDPAAYGRLLRDATMQVRAHDPGAVVLVAALAPNVEQGGANMSEVQFLDELYHWGGAEWFDVVAGQLYDFSQPIDAEPDPDQLNWRRVELLREVMEAHGDAQTAVWAVSFGLSDAIPAAIEGARSTWPWLGPALWAAWARGETHDQYALIGAVGQSGPDLETLAGLALVPTMAWPGVYPADHASGRYEGDWRITPSGADIGQSGDRLVIPFRGTRLDLNVRRGNYRAFLFASVDGQPANALPRDADGRAYIALYDPLRAVDSVTLASDLPFGDHVAEIVADRGWGQWAIVSWAAVSEEPGRAPWLSLALSLGAAALLIVLIWYTWHDRWELLAAVDDIFSRYRALDDWIAVAVAVAAALLFYIMIGDLPSLAALGLLAVVLLLRPEMGLPLIALALPFYQVGKPLLGKVFSMVEILTLLTLLGWAVDQAYRRWRQRERGSSLVVGRGTPTRRLTALDWGVVALVVIGAASLLWTEHGRVAARELRTVVLGSALFYTLLRAMVRDRPTAWRVVDAWVLGAVLISVVGLVQWAFGKNLITAEGVWRVRGFYGSPNNLALYLGRVLPVGVALAAWGRVGKRRWAYGLATVVTAVAILLTYSRGAWLVGVPVSLLFLAAVRGRRALLVTIGALLLAVVLVLLIVGPGRLTSLLDTGAGTTFFRLQLWQSSLSMVRDHPLLGVGLDNFLYQYRTHYVLPTAWAEFNLSHPHNVVLDFWLRLGLPGLVVFGWLVVGFFRRGWKNYRRLLVGNWRLLQLGLMAGMVNVVAHGLVDNAFFLVDLAFVFMLMLALVQVLPWEPAGVDGSSNA